MAKSSLRFAALLLPVAMWATSGSAQSTHFSLGLGYQWVDVNGNDDMYRSQVNQREGFVLEHFSFLTSGLGGSGLVDRVRVDADNLGPTGYGRLRLQAGLARAYKLDVSYTRSQHFSALPALANPFVDEGIIPGEQTFRRDAETVDLNLELLPGATVTPLIGYTRTTYSGPGRTTYFVGQNEFRLDSSLDEADHELRAGAQFHLGTFSATVLEAWREFHQTDELALVPGAGAGNNSVPVLGQSVSLDQLSRRDRTEGSYAVTTGSFSGAIGERVRVSGSFARADFQAELNDDESLTGNLVSFELARFFGGLDQVARGKADAPDWRGNALIETEPVDGLDISLGYTRTHRELDGFAFVTSLYSSTVNYAGLDPRDVTTLLAATTAMDRDEKALEAKVATRNLGPVKLWAAWSKADQDLTLTPDAAEIVVPGGQGGSFDRTVKRTSAGATLTVSGLKVGLDWHKDTAENAIIRLDALNSKRWRLRADWALAQFLHVVGTGEKITADNPTTDIGYELETKHTAVDLDVIPVKDLTLRFGYGRYQTDSNVTVRVPQDFTLEPSVYSEDGKEKQGGLTYKVGRFALDTGFSRFENDGSLALRLDRTFARLDLDFTSRLGASLQYDRNEYRETVLSLANYDAKRYGFFLRWQQ